MNSHHHPNQTGELYRFTDAFTISLGRAMYSVLVNGQLVGATAKRFIAASISRRTATHAITIFASTV